MENDLLIQKRKQHIQDGSANVSASSSQNRLGEIDHTDVINKHKPKKDFTWHLALAIAACTLGSSFQFGYNTGIVNAPEKVLKNFYNTTYEKKHNDTPMGNSIMTELWAVTVAIYCIGGGLGGVSAGYFADKFGRKRLLLMNNVIMLVAVAVEISSKLIPSYELLIVGRLIVGVNAGINTGTAPMYLSEIAPTSLRGLCGTFNQLCITFGVLMSTVMGLKNVMGTDKLWPYAFGVPLILVAWQLCTLTCCPESPRWLLISRNSEEEAKTALKWLRMSEDVEDEIDEMISEREMAKHLKKFTVRDLVDSPDLREPLKISLMMHLSQQLSGINAVIQYSTSIFMSANLDESAAQYATLATGAVNVSMTFVSALIMDRLGRRTLHLTGLGGMFIASYILAVGLIFQKYYSWLSYICVLAVIMYIIFFATGPGAIPWFFVAELFSQGPRSAAVSVGVLTNWSANFVVGLTYPFLNTFISSYSFIPFVVLLGLFWIYTFLKVPETKGKPIEEIAASFRTSNRQSYSRLPTDDYRE